MPTLFKAQNGVIGLWAAGTLKPGALPAERTYRRTVFATMPTIFCRKHKESPGGERRRALLRQDDGFTLIELLISSVLGLVVFGGILGVLETSQQVQARDTEWALTMQEGRTGLARIAREIRQAYKIEKAEAGTIEFLAQIGTSKWRIKYECGVEQPGTTYHECVRKAVGSTETIPSTGGAPVVRDVLNPTKVFCYSHGAAACTESPTATERAEATVATLRVQLPAKGTLKQAGSSGYTHSVVLENAAFIRNCSINGC
jgi:prepilin-type N-terminal cleavage/methylation domain-containing protein